MGKPPTLVPLSEEEQKLVREVLKRICIRMKLYCGQDQNQDHHHHLNHHLNKAILVRSEVRSLF